MFILDSVYLLKQAHPCNSDLHLTSASNLLTYLLYLNIPVVIFPGMVPSGGLGGGGPADGDGARRARPRLGAHRRQRLLRHGARQLQGPDAHC